MLNWFLSTSLLIAVLLLIRRVLRDKMDPRLTYALWLLAALRILVPVSLFSLPLSVATFTQESGLTGAVEEVRYTTEHETTYSSSTGSYNDDPSTLEDAEWFQEADWFGYRGVTDVHIVDKQEVTAAEAGGNPESGSSYARLELEITRDRFFTLRVIWYAGMAAMVLWFLFTDLRFRLRLRRVSLPAQVDSPLPVRVMPGLVSPCLFGLFRPAVYVTPECLSDETRLRHTLTHELTHYRHKDHWWAAVRCVCLIIQWFNPLVWLAAYLSRQDCELACDASVIKRLGEDQRLSYGKTLVDMVAAVRTPGALLQTATTMTGGKKSIAQRIRLIVKRPKMTAATLIAVLLIAALAVGCTFGGAAQKDERPALEDYFGVTYVKAGDSVVDHVQPIAISHAPTKASIGEITITENYFGCFDGQERDWGKSITDPVYTKLDFDPSAYGQSDRFYPALDDFFGGYESITAYEMENADKPLHLLILDGELWLAIHVGEVNCFILRLEEASQETNPTITASQFLEQHTEAELFELFVVATYANREYVSTTDLTSDDLFRMAVLAADQMDWYDKDTGCYVIPITDLTGILDAYLVSYQFDAAQVSYGTYDAAADTIRATALGFGTGMSSYSFGSAEVLDNKSLCVRLLDRYSQGITVTAKVTEDGVKFVSCESGTAGTETLSAAELIWEFPYSTADEIDTAFPINFDFPYDHYNANIDGGAGYVYANRGVVFGLTLFEKNTTLYWSPYFDRSPSDPDTPNLTLSVYGENDVTLFTAIFTFHLLERDDDSATYSAEVTLYGNTNYTCVKDPDTGGALFVETDATAAELSETHLTYLVLEPEIALLNSNSFTFSDPEELSISELYTLFLVLTDYEILEQKYNAGDELFYFTGDFITAQLQKYFKSFRFDITEHERYDPAADAIVTPIASGFGGDRYTQMTSLEWADENTVVFTLSFYDNYELTGTPYMAKEYAIEFYNEGYYYLYAVERNPAAELAQSIYSAIVGDYASRDFYMEVTDGPEGSSTTTRIHMTDENSWNLRNDVSGYQWAYTSSDGSEASLPITISTPDGNTWLRCWADSNRVMLVKDGTMHFFTAEASDGRTLFDHLLWAADDAIVHEAYGIVIDGSVTDYETVVEEYARQFSANLSALPEWASSKPEGVVYRTSGAEQAYFGEGVENFCGYFGLYFSPEMGMSDWQAGSGMDEETEGKYTGWWKWGIGADFARNEDGDWVCTGTYTGGAGLTYPTPLKDATVEELVYYFYHTWGNNHDYLIPYYICQKPVSELDELNRALDTRENPSSLCLALGTFLRDYGHYNDLQLTYDILTRTLDAPFAAKLKEGYTAPIS